MHKDLKRGAMTSPVIALASDHAGFELKDSMKVVLEEHSFPFRDCLLTFLKTRFAGGRHARRVAKMSAPVSQRAP